ncbi:MAG: hypothetical protein PHU68_01125 [Paludibacter sp.]|nr:hypothetical protein [Paludibacter sp.]
MIARVALDMGLAITMADAAKIINPTPFDYDLQCAYVVLAATFNFRQSSHTVHQLYRLASSGIAVVVGVKKLQPEYEFMCSIYEPGVV